MITVEIAIAALLLAWLDSRIALHKIRHALYGLRKDAVKYLSDLIIAWINL
jgi:hypothetical protein